jgi:protein O-mannosyl-transferase
MRLGSGRRRWIEPAIIVALSAAASFMVVLNDVVQDDIPVIVRNPAVHQLGSLAAHFRQPYWPKPFSPYLYRPLSSVLFTFEWVAGHGKPWFLHGVSVVLYAAVCLAVLALCRRLLPPNAALAAAAVFAVHPLHVESVAGVVNQAELAAALCVVVAVCGYLDWRAAGSAPGGKILALFACAYAAACLFKESGIVLPGLLAAAELTVVRDPRPLSVRLRQLWPLVATLALVGAGFIVLRTSVLSSFAGTFTTEVFRDSSSGQRTLTMLGVVPEWARLFTWPAHLQVDYSPREIVAATRWEWGQTVGLLILAPTALLALIGVGRRWVVSFGILWMAIAIFPVSNLLVPTGIVLAERTLFLPSVGMALVLGGGLAAIAPRLSRARPAAQVAAVGALGLIVLAGAVRSALRYRDWHDTLTFWYRAVEDAPESYRARAALGGVMFAIRQNGTGERLLREAIRLYPDGLLTYQILGDRYRLAGLCAPAIATYNRALELSPKSADTRASLIACLLHDGRYADAHDVAAAGIAERTWPSTFRELERTADSAMSASAPAGSVQLRAPDSSDVGPSTRP